jgi:hypothetical protein
MIYKILYTHPYLETQLNQPTVLKIFKMGTNNGIIQHRKKALFK